VLTPDKIESAPINADICAAGNIGFRSVADPQRWDIFPRLRTEQISETEVSVTNWRGWFGKFQKDIGGRIPPPQNDENCEHWRGWGDLVPGLVREFGGKYDLVSFNRAQLDLADRAVSKVKIFN